jgi:hypothetical protein
MQSLVSLQGLLTLTLYLFFPIIILVVGIIFSRYASFRRGSAILLIIFGGGELLIGFSSALLININLGLGFSAYFLMPLVTMLAIGIVTLSMGILFFRKMKPKTKMIE